VHERYTIVRVEAENYRTKTLVLDRPLKAGPGQFAMVWLPGVGEKPFSIAADDPLALTVVAVGPFSEAIHRLVPGDAVWVRGPLGQGFTLPEASTTGHLLLVGGGYGVAPLLFLARRAVAAGYGVDVCIGAKTAVDVLLRRQFEALAVGTVVGTAVGTRVTTRVTTEDGTLGARGLVTEAVGAAVAQARPDVVYACGPVGMLEAVERQCDDLGLPHQLSWEAIMRCGMGLCGACERHGGTKAGWLVCHDGPVDRG